VTSSSGGLGDYGVGDPLAEGFKGLPLGEVVTAGDIAGRGWNVLRGDVSTPVAVLRLSALEHNVETMRQYCAAAGVSLAPHAKTTLSPELVARQAAAGAWAFTAAVPFHVQLLWAFGVQRVLLANELLDPAALAWAVRELEAHSERELICYVDSHVGLDAAAFAVAASGGTRTLPVVVELGYAGGRTGVRSTDDAVALAQAVAASPHLRLAGVAAYEGTIATVRTPASLAAVDAFLQDVRRLANRLAELDLFARETEPIVTAGGSMFFDRVTAALGPLAADGFRIVLRSGCYLTHDHGLYASGSPATAPGWVLPAFESALEVWARVVSRPEPGLALLNAGRRDLSHDSGLPTPLRGHSADGMHVDLSTSTVTALSDQHAFLQVPADSPLAVGDLVGLGISHPCTTLDRWRLLLMVDDDYTVVGSARTYF